MPLVIAGLVLAAVGMAVFPASAALGIGGLIAAMVVLYTGINLQRSPLHALVADLLPSRYRSLGTASVTFQMCVGAIVFLMLGRALGMRVAFLVAAGTVLAIAAAFAWGLREEASSHGRPRRRRVAVDSWQRWARPPEARCRACARCSSPRCCCS